jgi:hypothetical protein
MKKLLFKPNYKNNAGFTLIEIITTFGIMVFVIFVFGSYIINSYDTISFVEELNEAVGSAKDGINVMNQELRECDSAENGAFAFNTADEQEVIFYSDIDIDDDTEKIRYFLDGTELKKGITEAGSPPNYSGDETISILSQYVQNGSTAIFTYYDENNILIADPTTNINQIRLIHVYLEINVTPQQAPVNYVIETNVHLRNLKSNY